MLKRFSFLAGGAFLGQLVVLASTPLLSRLYSPDDFGLLGLFLSFTGFAIVLSGFRLENAIVSVREDSEAAHLCGITIIIGFFVSLLAGGFFFLLQNYGWLGYSIFSVQYVPLIAVTVFLGSTFFVVRYWLIRCDAYPVAGSMTLAQNLGRVGIQIAAGIVGIGGLGLALGEPIGRGFGVVVGGRRSLWRQWRTAWRVQPFSSRRLLKTHYRYPLYSLPSTLLNTATLMLPVPLIASNYGVTEAGVFTLASRMLAGPLSLITRSIADAFQDHFARSWHDNPQAARSLFWRTTAGLSGIMIPAGVAAFFLAPLLFAPIFGTQWSTAGQIAALLCVWVFSSAIVSPLSRIIFVLNGQASKFVYDIGGILVLYYCLAQTANRSLEQSVQLFGWAMAGMNIVYFVILVTQLYYQRTHA